jgi:hypothetical protein
MVYYCEMKRPSLGTGRGEPSISQFISSRSRCGTYGTLYWADLPLEMEKMSASLGDRIFSIPARLCHGMGFIAVLENVWPDRTN